MAGNIFVNYRREDAKADAGRIHDWLVRFFGAARVFMDVAHLEPGQFFDQELEKALDRSEVFLAVIGRNWLSLLRERAQSSDHDFVHQEIARALKLGIFVIPVLVDGGQLPRPADLPEALKGLARCQAHVIAHERFDRDADDLVRAIRKQLRKAARRRPWWGVAAGVLATLCGTVGIALWGTPVSFVGAWLTGSPAGVGRLRVGQTFRECADCPEMVVIPAGVFLMGSPVGETGRSGTEGPQHQVRIARPLAVGKYEVTVKEYEGFVVQAGGGADANGCNVWTAYGHRFEQDRSYITPSFSQLPTHPVVCVGWQAASGYADWLSTRTGHKYRLLSEAEWEYAARAGSTTRYPFGDDDGRLCDYGNGADRTSAFQWGNRLCSDATGGQTAPVGKYRPNAFGLHDVIGNAAEWVQDCWHQSYDGAPGDGGRWPNGDCKQRVVRGGAWDNGPSDLRSAARGAYSLQPKDTIGFRVAREIE